MGLNLECCKQASAGTPASKSSGPFLGVKDPLDGAS